MSEEVRMSNVDTKTVSCVSQVRNFGLVDPKILVEQDTSSAQPEQDLHSSNILKADERLQSSKSQLEQLNEIDVISNPNLPTSLSKQRRQSNAKSSRKSNTNENPVTALQQRERNFDASSQVQGAVARPAPEILKKPSSKSRRMSKLNTQRKSQDFSAQSTHSAHRASVQFKEGDENVKTLRHHGSIIRLLSKDLKSAKQLTGKNAEIIFQKDTMGRYVGKIAKGLPHGFGVKTWPDGKRYQGSWNRGKMHGKGELIIGEGESYTGEFRNGLPWGLGIRKWANGDYYEGEYTKGFQQGSGLFISNDQGWKYDGQWETGKMSGIAVCQWSDGTTYTGEWKDCMKEGQGTLTFPDGSIYKGVFKNDQPSGVGSKAFPDGSTYEGNFQNGMFHGKGKFKQASDNSEYDGWWRQNNIRGHGVKTSNDGQIEITGNFDAKGLVSGKGQKKWKKIKWVKQ